jgi:hypothetical protein
MDDDIVVACGSAENDLAALAQCQQAQDQWDKYFADNYQRVIDEIQQLLLQAGNE